jgi:hypothetical protein
MVIFHDESEVRNQGSLEGLALEPYGEGNERFRRIGHFYVSGWDVEELALNPSGDTIEYLLETHERAETLVTELV